MAANWRDKYLAVLDEQESQERRFQNQVKQLRVCIDQLALAADGIDPSLDELLKPLKQKKSNARINVDDISKSATQVVERRDTRLSVSNDALNALVDCLKKLNPTRSTQAELNAYQRNISKRIGKLHAYPQLLRELSELQIQTLDNVIHKRPNWLASLFGAPAVFNRQQQQSQIPEGNENDRQEGEENLFQKPTEEDGEDNHKEDGTVDDKLSELSQKETVEPSYIDGEFEVVSEVPSEKAVDKLLSSYDEDVTNSVQQNARMDTGTDNKFTKIEDKISIILTQMLDSVDVAECVKEKFLQSKARIQQGLNWYEMVVTLEDIRDLFLQALYAANFEFETYLTTIDVALADVKRLIPNQISNSQNQHALTSSIKQNLHQQSDLLVARMNQTTDLESLKHSVASHVSELSQQLQDLDALSGQLIEGTEETELLQSKIQELEQNQSRLKQALLEQKYRALHDVLTGLPNRDFYNQWIFEKYTAWNSTGTRLTICICDVDNFKAFNDTYGHQTGDRVLKVIGKLLTSIKKPENFVGRFGGEEFVIAISEQELSQCEALVEKVRTKLASTSFRFQEKPVVITASFGLTEFKPGDSIETALKRADDALYKAKADGRNQLCTA